MTKQEWLNEKIVVDEYGRDYNLSDVPMTYMTREKAFSKRRYDEGTVDELYLAYYEDHVNELKRAGHEG